MKPILLGWSEKSKGNSLEKILTLSVNGKLASDKFRQILTEDAVALYKL